MSRNDVDQTTEADACDVTIPHDVTGVARDRSSPHFRTRSCDDGDDASTAVRDALLADDAHQSRAQRTVQRAVHWRALVMSQLHAK